MLLISPAWTVPAPQEIQQATREVLNRPEFRPRPDWEIGLNTVADWLATVWHLLVLWLQSHPTWRWLLFFVLSILLVLLLIRLVRLLPLDLVSGSTVERRQGIHATASGKGSEESAAHGEAAWAEVRQAITQGDSYGAVWLLHRRFLGLLDSRGLLTFTRWKTNSDYLQECPHTNASYQTLLDITVAYEQIIYAHRPVPLHTLSTLLAQVEDDQNSPRS